MQAVLVIIQCALVIFAAFVSGLTGFGNGIIFQTGWAIVAHWISGAGDLKEGVAITFFGGLTSAFLIGRDTLRTGDVKWDIVVGLTPGSVIFNWLGVAALSVLDQGGLKKVLGLIFIVTTCWQIYLKCRTVRAQRLKEHIEIAEEYRRRGHADASAGSGESDGIALSIAASDEYDGVSSTHGGAYALAPADVELVEVARSSTSSPPASSSDDAALQVTVSGMPDPVTAMSPSSLTATASERLVSDAQAASDADADGDVEPVAPPPNGCMPFSWSPRLWFAALAVLWQRREFRAAVVVGCVAGFLGGCFGTMGPPIMMFFAFITITKGEIRGTFAWYSLVILIPRIIGMVVFHNFSAESWLVYILVPPFTFIGTALGSRAHHSVDTNVVMMMLQGLVLLSTVALCGAGDGSVFGTVIVGVYGLIAIVLIAFLSLLYMHRRRFQRAHPEYADTIATLRAEKKEAKRIAAEAEKQRCAAAARSSPPAPTPESEAEAESDVAAGGPTNSRSYAHVPDEENEVETESEAVGGETSRMQNSDGYVRASDSA